MLQQEFITAFEIGPTAARQIYPPEAARQIYPPERFLPTYLLVYAMPEGAELNIKEIDSNVRCFESKIHLPARDIAIATELIKQSTAASVNSEWFTFSKPLSLQGARFAILVLNGTKSSLVSLQSLGYYNLKIVNQLSKVLKDNLGFETLSSYQDVFCRRWCFDTFAADCNIEFITL